MVPLRVFRWLIPLAIAPEVHALAPAVLLRNAGHSYAALSTAHPLSTAAATAGVIIGCADMTCQT
eukprot:7131943-Prymnesium_polylepis.1